MADSSSVLLTRREVEALTRLGRTSIYRLTKAGAMPAPIRVGHKKICWRRDELEAWLASRSTAIVAPASEG